MANIRIDNHTRLRLILNSLTSRLTAFVLSDAVTNEAGDCNIINTAKPFKIVGTKYNNLFGMLTCNLPAWSIIHSRSFDEDEELILIMGVTLVFGIYFF